MKILRTLKRLLCAYLSLNLSAVKQRDATGTYQLLLLQAKVQIPVLTPPLTLRTLRRLLFALQCSNNKVANMKDANGFYQLKLLQQKLQAHVHMLKLTFRTPRELISARVLPILRSAKKTVASGTYQNLLLQAHNMKSVLTNLLMLRIPIRLVSVNNLRIKLLANKMDVYGTRLHSTRSQARNQIPVLINLARTMLRLKFNSVKDSPPVRIAKTANAFGFSHQLWLQPRDQIPVLTKIQIPRTLRRLLCA
jgi:hypothetical protein